MRRALKFICIGLSLILTALYFSGCSFVNSIIDKKNIPDSTEYSQKIIDCFNNRDKSALKELLCEKTKSLEDIDEQIQESFDFLKGKITSYNKDVCGAEEKSIEHGTIKQLTQGLIIQNALTDKNITYRIDVTVNYIYLEDQERKGITQIYIENEKDGSQIILGYSWPDHHSDGAAKASEIAESFNNKDFEELKSYFTNNIQKLNEIDGQINRAINFVNGRILMGKVEDDGLEYDGSHDFNTDVTDKETIINHEPVKTTLEVHCTNMETDTGRVYEMYFTYILLDDDDWDNEGVVKIIILDENGTKYVIG